MLDEALVKVDGGGEKHDDLRECEFWVEKDITFALKRGKCRA